MKLTLDQNLMSEIIRVYSNQEFQSNRDHTASRYGHLASLPTALTVASLVPKTGSMTTKQLAKAAKVSPMTAERVVDLLEVSGLIKNVGKGRAAQYRLV